MNTVRCFIAIFLCPSLYKEVTMVQKKLANSGTDIKWVEPSNLHFTLQFLGDVENVRIPNIIHTLKKCLTGFSRFNLKLNGTGAFPNFRNPRVLWIGVSDGSKQLLNLTHMVREAMKIEGFIHDGKNFSPHLTIGRIRSARNLRPLREKLDLGFDITGTMEVEEVRFTASELTAKGPIYNTIDIVRLDLPSDIQCTGTI
ncbi:MAG: RNA 2',3'-cyclic phosphodiesterase [Firmicutes bacterium]|nr:RNA 2',3'-cyclic phosphodiesterase [Bacillota bacterium]